MRPISRVVFGRFLFCKGPLSPTITGYGVGYAFYRRLWWRFFVREGLGS